LWFIKRDDLAKKTDALASVFYSISSLPAQALSALLKLFSAILSAKLFYTFSPFQSKNMI
jgi:hypothetical protein